MRWYVSYPILAAGLAVGFNTVYPNKPSVSRSAEAATLSSPRAAPEIVLAHDLEAALPSRLALFSPGVVLATAEARAVEPPHAGVLDYLAQKLAPLDLSPVTAPAPPAMPVTVAAWTRAVVTTDTEVGSARASRSGEAPISRQALARDIQAELRRVGCYLGDIDGVWGSGSKRAASYFMDRVNAALPTQEPDVFMLSLLRAQDEEVCGAACPNGQGLAASGRCVPSTLLAQADRVPSRRGDRVATASITPRRALPYGRMSIGGPKPSDSAAALTAELPVAIGAEATRDGERTAALEPAVAEAPEAGTADLLPPAKVVRSSFDADDVAPVRKPKRSARAAKTTRNGLRQDSYRHVQKLFEHPLGRL